jgi:hypothetical protein
MFYRCPAQLAILVPGIIQNSEEEPQMAQRTQIKAPPGNTYVYLRDLWFLIGCFSSFKAAAHFPFDKYISFNI